MTRHLRKLLCNFDEPDYIVKNESIPTFKHLAQRGVPDQKRQALYELIQWALWIDEKYEDHEIIVKKCSGFPHAMDLVSEFLGDARYECIVTTRHPAAIYRSNRNIDDLDVIPIDDESYLFPGGAPAWWQSSPDEIRTLYYWHLLYSRLVETLPEPEQSNLHVVTYGQQENAMREVVQIVSPESSSSLEADLTDDPFRLTEREYGPFWSSSITDSMIRDVNQTWRSEGIDFPVTPQRIE